MCVCVCVCVCVVFSCLFVRCNPPGFSVNLIRAPALCCVCMWGGDGAGGGGRGGGRNAAGPLYSILTTELREGEAGRQAQKSFFTLQYLQHHDDNKENKNNNNKNSKHL